MAKTNTKKPRSGKQCCQAEDARHCTRQRPGVHRSSPGQLPGIFVPHYENHCSCFSCLWVRETNCPFILSKTQHASLPYPVANPTHDRVPQDERQRLLTPVAKERFQIMYIYAMQLEEGIWGWVIVLPPPLLPFLLTNDKYSRVSRVSRHPEHGWFGLDENGQQVDIGHAMSPPLYNPLYQHYGYDPQCSPYRLYRPAHNGEASDSKADLSSDDNTNPSPQDSTNLSTMANASTQNTTPFPSPDSKLYASPDNRTAPPVIDQVTSALTKLAKPSAEAQATSSNLPADQSTLDNDKWLENPEWIVFDPSYANPPRPSGLGSHNGTYNLQHYGNRHTDWRNTTIFVGGLNNNMTQADLHYWFEGFGELMYVRKKVGQTCGFVQYPDRKEAEMAMSQMQGFSVHGARLRLSWGDPEKHMDPDYWRYYRQSAWRAHGGWQRFRARMERGESRREDDPDFWNL